MDSYDSQKRLLSKQNVSFKRFIKINRTFRLYYNSTMERENYELIDNSPENRYEFRIGEEIAKIEYIKTKNNEIYLTHTEVPVSLEGRGIGSQLIEKTLQNIELQGLRLVPLCPFVAGYIQKHPDWRRIVMRGINI